MDDLWAVTGVNAFITSDSNRVVLKLKKQNKYSGK